ncbi:MAG: N-acetyltransferase [Pseudomonadales bacterium]|nr:N-acetyltransferase [Pseudomonadales bacterium]
MTLRIAPLDGSADLDRFIRFPWTILAEDPAWVPPLLMDRKQQLSPKHPFFEHAEWQGWLAWEGDRCVGRISAQIDRRNEAEGRPALGSFGMLDAIDDARVHAALLEAAEGWLRARGKTRIEGPFNLGVNQELGTLVDGFDTPPYFMMPHGPRWAGAHIEAAGYEKAVDLLAYEIEPAFEHPPAMARLLARLGRELVFRPIDKARAEDDLRTMCAIFNDAWSNNWRFLPFSEKEFLAIGKEMLLVVPPDAIQIGEIDGTAVSFAVLLPNINEAIADLNGRLLPFGWAKLLWRLKVRGLRSGRVALMGVRKAHQGGRLGAALAYGVIDGLRTCAVRQGMTAVELSWILEENQPMRHIIENLGGVLTKRYRMYGRDLPAAS